MIKNYGLNLERERLEQSEKDFVFGGFSQPGMFCIPENEREQYLPEGERQNIGEEKMDCTTRSPLNALEAMFNFALAKGLIFPQNEVWLRENGYINSKNKVEFSDRFNATLSDTTRDGNSLKAPLQCIHADGLVPKSKLPQAFTFNEHVDKEAITGSLKALGQQFLSRFKINYEKVNEVHYKELLKEDMLGVAGYAWPPQINGEYQKSDSSPNHAFLVYKNQFYAFDNYEESIGDYIKKLSPSYNFLDYGYRIYITAQYLPSNTNWITDILSKLFQVFFSLREKAVESNPPVPILEVKPIPMETKKDKLLKVCLEALDTDVTPKDNVPDEVACSEVLSTLIKKVLPDFPIVDSTKNLDFKLFTDKRFKRILEPKRGAIIVSPRTVTTNGHCGIWITSEKIASNSSLGSLKGKFIGNYDWSSWIKEFKEKRKLSIYIYELIN